MFIQQYREASKRFLTALYIPPSVSVQIKLISKQGITFNSIKQVVLSQYSLHVPTVQALRKIQGDGKQASKPNSHTHA